MSSSHTSAPPSEAATTNVAKPYRCGTLRYTLSGVLMVFFWMLWGDFVMCIMESVIPGVLSLTLDKHYAASNTIIILIISQINDAMNFMVNPAVSFRSDRYRGQWGRRIPFLFWPTPALTLILVALAFSPEIGRWAAPALHGMLGINGTTILVIGILVAVFQFFNMFIGSTYYYLFNDVVPERFMGRFSAFFRIFGTLAGIAYSLWMFPYVLTHTRWIFLAGAGVYFIGFIQMCIGLKEGDYPPPPPLIKHAQGFWARLWVSVQTYFKECYSHPHYLWMFGMGASLWCAGKCSAVSTLWFLHLPGITLEKLGQFSAVLMFVSILFMIPLGWFSDKIHPVRVVTFTVMWFPIIALVSFFYVHDYHSMIVMALLGTADGWFYAAAVLPMMMMIFPKERYGQFGSAEAIARTTTGLLMAFVAGFFLDTMKDVYLNLSPGTLALFQKLGIYVNGPEDYRRWMYVWTAFFQFLACICAWKVYRSWQKYGGRDYVAPSVGPVAGEAAPANPGQPTT